MADLSKIKLNGTEYNLKDSIARNSIPTNISQLNNDIGFITSDEKVKQTQVSFNNTYIPILLGAGNMSTGNITASVSKDSNFWYNPQPGTLHTRQLQLGNNKVVDKIPVNTSDLTNDSGFISSETDPTVPAWAKASVKPTYTAAEVGATTTSDVNSLIASAIGNINSFEVAIVSSLPTENIDTHTIYFMANDNNAYDEYMYINNNWELIGSNNIDLSGYMTTSHAANSITSANINTWDKASSLWDVTSDNDQENHYWWTLDIQQSGLVKYSNAPGSRGALRYIKIPAYNDGATTNIQLEMPTHSGKIALTSQIPTVPTNVSAFTNDSGYLTSFTETDPTVPAWAKAETKPTYTAAEVGAIPNSTSIVQDLQYNSIRKALRMSKNGTMQDVITIATLKTELEVPTTASDIGALPSSTTYVSSFNGSTGAITYTAPVTSVNGQTGEVSLTIPAATTVTQTLTSGTKIGEVNGTELFAPATITETDPVYSASPAATITTEKITAWDAKSNFSGSYNDLSDKPTIPTVPTNVSAFTNDSGYLTSFTETDPTVPAWAKAETKPTYTAAEVDAMATTHAANAITSTDISNWNSKTSNTGTVTSVRVQATSPVQSSTNTAQTTTLNTTISLANGYGDTKNPYGTKTANYVLAGPTSGNAAVPGFRKLVAADIPAIGNITNAGDITTTATIASGDRLIINDESASKVTNSSITFGSSTTQYLANNGTWQNAYDDTALAARVTALENLEWATYYSGRSNPSNSQGQNGDIYLQY